MTLTAFFPSLLVGAVFLVSAVPKLRHPKGFILTVLEYHILPPALGEFYARLLPLLELLAALLLLTGVAVRSAAILTSLVLVSFVAGIGINLFRGRNLDCGCFGEVGGKRIGPGLLLQDLGLLTASLVPVVLSRDWLLPAPWSLFWADGFLSAAAPAVPMACAAVTVVCAAVLPRTRRPGRSWKAAFQRRRSYAEMK